MLRSAMRQVLPIAALLTNRRCLRDQRSFHNPVLPFPRRSQVAQDGDGVLRGAAVPPENDRAGPVKDLAQALDEHDLAVLPARAADRVGYHCAQTAHIADNDLADPPRFTPSYPKMCMIPQADWDTQSGNIRSAVFIIYSKSRPASTRKRARSAICF